MGEPAVADGKNIREHGMTLRLLRTNCLLTFARPLPVLVGNEFIQNFFFQLLRCPSYVNFSDLIKTLM